MNILIMKFLEKIIEKHKTRVRNKEQLKKDKNWKRKKTVEVNYKKGLA